jgi:CrcB protein
MILFFISILVSGFISFDANPLYLCQTIFSGMKELLFVGLGGAAGSMLRWLIGRSLNVGFPWGTLLVNVAGCLIVGLLLGLAERGHLSSPAIRVLLVAGFCGGFTTFSAFMGENLAMLRGGEFLHFALYAAGSMIFGLAAGWLGWLISKPA